MGDKIFISHLDLMRLFERALRRAQIQFSTSKGFNPHPILSIPLALGLGIEGLNEALELGLDEWIEPEEFRERLNAQLPAGIEIGLPETMPIHDKGRPMSVVYNVISIAAQGCEVTDTAIEGLLNQREIKIARSKNREERTVNIRPSITDIKRTENGLMFRLNVTPEGMARPEEILKALGIEYKTNSTPLKIIRTEVNLK